MTMLIQLHMAQNMVYISVSGKGKVKIELGDKVVAVIRAKGEPVLFAKGIEVRPGDTLTMEVEEDR